MQGLRAEYQINVRRAVDNRLTFLTGHASPHTDDQFRFALFEFFPAAQLMKHLVLRFFTNGTGIKQENVGIVRIIGHLDLFS